MYYHMLRVALRGMRPGDRAYVYGRAQRAVGVTQRVLASKASTEKEADPEVGGRHTIPFGRRHVHGERVGPRERLHLFQKWNGGLRKAEEIQERLRYFD